MQKISITIIYSSFLKFAYKNLAYTYYINLDEAMIRYKKLRLTCRELRSSCKAYKSCRDLLKSGVFFRR